MSTRTAIAPHKIVSAQSLGASFNASPTLLLTPTKAAFQAIWSAGSTPIGAISIEGCLDYAAAPMVNEVRSGNWVTLPLLYLGVIVTSVPLTGNTGTALIELLMTSVYAVRFVYTRTSGSGLVDVYVNAKVA